MKQTIKIKTLEELSEYKQSVNGGYFVDGEIFTEEMFKYMGKEITAEETDNKYFVHRAAGINYHFTPGMIKSVEPIEKVINWGEYWRNHVTILPLDLETLRNDRQISIKQAFETGHANGRLERDLEVREVLTLARKVGDALKTTHMAVLWPELNQAIKNLKPLK